MDARGLTPVLAAAKSVNADASGLFGSDSESEDEKPKKLKKAAPKPKAAEKPKKAVKRKSRDDEPAPRAPEGRHSPCDVSATLL